MTEKQIIHDWLSGTDIYLIDQILRGRLDGMQRILDAGCGAGRNLTWFLRGGFDVYGIDRDPLAVEMVRASAGQLGCETPDENFLQGHVESMPWPDNHFDMVISSAVLHFAENTEQFDKMVEEMWRVLSPDGIFFARLTSDIGLENKIKHVASQIYEIPDGSQRYLVNQQQLLALAKKLGGEFLDPIKTTNVQDLRCMTTIVLRKVG